MMRRHRRRWQKSGAALGLLALAAIPALGQTADFEQGRVLDGPGHVLPHPRASRALQPDARGAA